MGKRIETDTADAVISAKFNGKDHYPFSNKTFSIEDDALAEVEKLNREQKFIVVNILSNSNNVYQYNFERKDFKGDVPKTFSKLGTFIINIGKLSFHCYINIEDFSEECIIFGIESIE